MHTLFNKLAPSARKARETEQLNFQRVSAVLADYGFQTIRLSNDWEGADFIAQHVGGTTFLKVQMKGRLTFDKKYLGKDIWVCFPDGGEWYLYPHDSLVQEMLLQTNIANTESWRKGNYHFPYLNMKTKTILERFKL